MTPNSKNPFQARAFVALAAAFSGLGLPMTGVAVHMLQMEPMTSERHAWMAAHTVLAAVFLVCGVWHILLNRRALWRHIQGAAAHVSREAVCAAALVVLVLAVAVGHAFHLG